MELHQQGIGAEAGGARGFGRWIVVYVCHLIRLLNLCYYNIDSCPGHRLLRPGRGFQNDIFRGHGLLWL